MASKVYYSPFIPAFSSNGAPVPDAKLYFFYTGTNTPAPAYLDSDMLIPASHPVEADLSGRFPNIYLDEAITYRVRITTSSGAPLGDDIDPYIPGTALRGDPGPAGPAGNVAATLAELKAAAVSNVAMIYDDAVYSWKLGDYTGLANDVSIVQSDNAAITVGAWVRARGVSVIEFGADPLGAVDSQSAFIAAATAAGVGGVVNIPPGDYLVEGPVNILDGQTWHFDGAVLTHTNNTQTILYANDVEDWAILGSVKLVGTLVTAGSAPEIGLRITNGRNYVVENVKAIRFLGAGFQLDGTDTGTYRGDQGQFANCSGHECTIARKIVAGGGAEYTTWTNWNATGNTVADEIGAGNTITIGGSIVDNVTGVKLVNGSNHGHGIYSGVNINHNTSENIHAISVITGFTFIGCHIYGNGISTGAIWLQGCKGITIAYGIVDCWIYNDDGAGSGPNYIVGNYFPNDYGVQFLTNLTGLDNIYVSDNYLPTGPSDLNDPSPVYAEATRASSQALVAATPLVFNNIIKDNRSSLSNSTGIFTAPVGGVYEISTLLSISAASGLTNSYIQIAKNGSTDIGYIPVVALSGTLGVGCGAVKILMEANDTLVLKANITGTSPTLNPTQSRISVALLR